MDPLRGETPVLLCCQRHRGCGQEALDPTHSLRRLDLQAAEEPNPRRETGCRRCYIRFPGGVAERSLRPQALHHSASFSLQHTFKTAQRVHHSLRCCWRSIANTVLLNYSKRLRDRLVCGVNHPGIQRKLLAEVDLTFKSALKLAQTMESSEKDAKKLQADSLLTHYDTSKPLILACDASDHGIGAVLSHIVDGNLERPVAYISRTLSAAEKHYSQLEKEALAIVFTVKKFYWDAIS